MPGACSLAPHIALREAAVPFVLAEVDYRTRQVVGGGDYHEINPKGYVPALLVRDGWLITEVPVILQYIEALAPGIAAASNAAPQSRYRSLEWLNYIATEIHKSFSPLFRPTTPRAFLQPGRSHLKRRLTMVECHLAQNRYLMGSAFSMADAYLFTVCRWLKDQELTLSDWPSLSRYVNEIYQRETVRAALAAEGLAAPE